MKPSAREADERVWTAPWLAPVAVGLLAAVAGSLLCLPLYRQVPGLALANVATSWAYVTTGLLVGRDRHQRPTAIALILAGVLRPLDFGWSWESGMWPAVGAVFGCADQICGLYALLSYPGRASRRSTLFVGALTAWLLLGRGLSALTSDASSNGYPAGTSWPTLVFAPGFADSVSLVTAIGTAVFAGSVLVILLTRVARLKGLDRIVVPPILVAGCLATVAAIPAALTDLPTTPVSPDLGSIGLVGAVADALVPAAFLVAAVQRRLLVSRVAQLSHDLSASDSISDVTAALRHVLHEPTVDIVQPHRPPHMVATGTAPRPDRLVSVIRSADGGPAVMITADRSLERYQDLFHAAVQTSAPALRLLELRERAARAETIRVEESRARLVEAELRARKRFERDLHDGPQQHLHAISAQLGALLTATPAGAPMYGPISRAIDELGAAIEELRDLAHGILPSVLTEHGLAAALEEVAARLPIPVSVLAAAERARPAVEAAAYFIACEALTNAVRHSHADVVQVWCTVAHGSLTLVVEDDGVGAADPTGNGMRNMADRVATAHGRLVVSSPLGRGTRIEVRLPCG